MSNNSKKYEDENCDKEIIYNKFINSHISESHKDDEFSNINLQQENISKTSIDNINLSILRQHLLPEMQQNEKQKREIKDRLIPIVSRLIWGNLIALILPFIIILLGLSLKLSFINNDLLNNHISTFIDFFKVYTVSILAEMVGVLYFIIKNVFDTSIVDLIPLFKKDTDKPNDKTSTHL